MTRVLTELQQVHRELAEQRYVRRADGLERVKEALRRLGEVGSPAGIIDRSAEALGGASDFDVVLVSSLEGASIRAQALWLRDDGASAERKRRELEHRAIALGYPLIEAEVAQRHKPTLVSMSASGRRAAPDLAAVLGWDAYCVAEISLDRSAIGLLHAARQDAGALDDLDLELVSRYADGLGQTFERAVLRDQLQRRRIQLQTAADWIAGQLLALSPATRITGAAADPFEGELAEVLTPREVDVLQLVARGQSNHRIAATLMIGEGTVKYHIKNILRKLQARTRAEAVSRYMESYDRRAAR
jgi:DNA-binding NarL/FixJ family response regulator